MGYGEGHNLILKAASRNGGPGLLLGGQSKTILLFPGDTHLSGNIFCRNTHVEPAIDVLGLGTKLGLRERVLQLSGSRTHSPASVGQIENSIGHAFCAAGQHYLILSGAYGVEAAIYCQHTGGACTHHRAGGHRLRYACQKGGIPGGVGTIGGLPTVTQEDLIHLAWLQAGALQGGNHYRPGQRVGLQRP